jgi:hypothetical protein
MKRFACILLFASLAVFCSPNSKGITVQDGARNSQPSGKTKKEKQNTEAPPNQTITIFNEPRSAENNRDQKQDREAIEIDRQLAEFTKYLVGVGLLQFAVLAVQAWLFFRQTKIMGQHKVSLEQLAKSQRAWLMVTVGTLPEITPDPNTLQILWLSPKVSNEGKTPAWIVGMRLRAEKFPRLEDLPAEPIYEGEGTMHFDGEATIPSGASVSPLRVGINVHDFIAIRRGASFLYVYGIVNYLDISRMPCSTRFCFLYHVQSGFNPVTEGFVFGGPTAYNKAT